MTESHHRSAGSLPDAIPSSGTPLDRRAIQETLRQDIVALRLRPGAKLSENELAARFGTSRAPVREALIGLVEDGLIDVRPQRGSFVSRLDLARMEQGRFVREALEVAIVRRAAERGIGRKASDDAAALLVAQARHGDDPETFTRLDDAFHRAFADATGLAGIWAIIEREKAQFDRLRFLSLPSATPVDVLIGQHRAILDAVIGGSPQAAEDTMRAHMAEVLKIVANLAAKHPDLIITDP